MKTLIIHPEDASTDFLRSIYNGLDCTVVNQELSRNELENLIRQHDRIIMFGHGDERGLFGFGEYVINSGTAYHLRAKECVAIWCYADGFFRRHNLKGIYSGMIISEYDEAILCCLHDFKQSDIDSSNELFSRAVKESIFSKKSKEVFLSIYKSDGNPIVSFNKKNYVVTSNSHYA